MTDQAEMLAEYRLTPEQIVEDARERCAPIVQTFCLFSGGNDSTVLAYRCRDLYDALAFIDTGTSSPGVIEHVRHVAGRLNKPLVVLEAGERFRGMVLGTDSGKGYGFPGPAQHGTTYNLLKGRQVEALVRDHKTHRGDRIGLLSGARAGESQRRKSNVKPVWRRGAQVWINPILGWTDAEMNEYRAAHSLPELEVAALLHRSGECNCGCFAGEGEREMLRDLWPEWFDATIGSLEREAEARGLPFAKWGHGRGRPSAVGPLCSDCQLTLTDD